MSLTTAARRWLVTDDDAVYECRHCGTTLEPIEWSCPSCGSIEIAEYDASSLE
jgi:rubrerythrin